MKKAITVLMLLLVWKSFLDLNDLCKFMNTLTPQIAKDARILVANQNVTGVNQFFVIYEDGTAAPAQVERKDKKNDF
jgi:hypothetical protein